MTPLPQQLEDKKKGCGIHTNRGICGRKGYLCGECKQEIKRKNKPREHNIELSGRLSENCITIKGNKLNLKWLGKSILVWSEENDRFN